MALNKPKQYCKTIEWLPTPLEPKRNTEIKSMKSYVEETMTTVKGFREQLKIQYDFSLTQ